MASVQADWNSERNRWSSAGWPGEVEKDCARVSDLVTHAGAILNGWLWASAHLWSAN